MYTFDRKNQALNPNYRAFVCLFNTDTANMQIIVLTQGLGMNSVKHWIMNTQD